MTTTKIVKTFSEKTTYQIESGGTICRVSWERLKDHLGSAVGLKGKEMIEGLVADDDGIHVRIGYKK